MKIIFLLLLFQINWRTVVCGVCLQFLLGLFCIRMELGRRMFGCLGAKVAVFFDFAKQGASFVYGNDLVYGNKEHNLLSVFAFSVSIIDRLSFD